VVPDWFLPVYHSIPGLLHPTRYTAVCLRVIPVSSEVGDAMNGTYARNGRGIERQNTAALAVHREVQG